MTVVIDVCGMAQVLFPQEKADKFSKMHAEADLILAPDLFVSELTNTLWKFNAAGKYNREECLKFIQDGDKAVGKLLFVFRPALAIGKEEKSFP